MIIFFRAENIPQWQNSLVKYKSSLQLIYMDNEIIGVRLNVDKALVDNETEKKRLFCCGEALWI